LEEENVPGSERNVEYILSHPWKAHHYSVYIIMIYRIEI
jgi:hypothetical protein